MPPADSALVVLVPDAEALVKPFRDRHDPSAAVSMPAHITLLYHFIPPDDLCPAVLDVVQDCLSRIEPFNFVPSEAKRLPGLLYLAPEPEEPFRALTRAIWDRYPERPPYAGKHSDVRPHLTVAQHADERQLDAVGLELRHASKGKFPIHAAVHEIALLDNGSGHWKVRHRFPLQAKLNPLESSLN